MDDDVRTSEQLLEELDALRRRVADLERTMAEHGPAEATQPETVLLNRVLLDALPCVALVLRSNRQVVISNRAGAKVGAVPGSQCFSTWGQREGPCPWCLAPAALATGKPQHLEVEALGTVWDASWIPLGSDTYLHYAFDISDQVQAKRALQESEERYRSLYLAVSDGIVVLDGNGIFVDANEMACEILGLPLEELRGRTLFDPRWDAIHEDGRPFPDESNPPMELLRARNSFRNVVLGVLNPKTSTRRWLMANAEPIFGSNQESLRAIVVTFADITDQKRAEEALRLSETRFRLLAENARDIVYRYGLNPVEGFTYVSPASTRIVGFSPQELYADPGLVFRLIHPKDLQTLRAELKDQQAVTIRVRHRDGHIVWTEQTITPVCDDNGNLLAIEGIARDVTERKRVEEALRESEARFAEAQRLAHLGSYEFQVPQGEVLWSEETFRILGLDPAQGEPTIEEYMQLVHPDDRPLVEGVVARAANEEKPFDFEYRVVLAGGEVKHIQSLGRPVVNEDGVVVRVIGTLMDITKRKQLETQLLRAQRLEAAGRIGAQVAHDFNNLLGPLVAYPQLMKMQLPANHPAVRFCDAMMDAANQMVSINENMLILGARGLIEEQRVDLNRLVEQVAGQMPDKPDTLVIDCHLASDLLPIIGTPSQLLRLIGNLLSNAREAMQDVGLLTLKTENVYVDVPFGRYNRVEIGEYVRLSVSDTGCGIPLEIRDRIFDAFFTTKRKTLRRGSGLGLSLVQAIVEGHRGFLDLASEVGRGTTFSVYLPVSQQALKETAVEGLREGTETILVVDDDPLQREIARELLGKLGYRVQVAASGEEAVAYLKKHPVDLLILDMVMPPGIDGAETYRRALKARPGQRAIILSGFAESEQVRKAQALGAGAYVRKPATLERLALAVREELDRKL